jgi:hypothetical protein
MNNFDTIHLEEREDLVEIESDNCKYFGFKIIMFYRHIDE